MKADFPLETGEAQMKTNDLCTEGAQMKVFHWSILSITEMLWLCRLRRSRKVHRSCTIFLLCPENIWSE